MRPRTAVNLALVFFALWPLGHLALVRAYDVNPWKLAGWGMYTTPQFTPLVSIECLTPDAIGRYELGSVHPDWQDELDDFVRRRRGLGRLARPDALGRRLLAVYPAILGVEITVERPFLDRRKGMVESATETYFYGR
jgi:hypothetical protein